MSADNAVTSFRLGDYLHILRRHWVAVLLCLVLGVGGSFAYLHWAPKQFQATTSVLVTPLPGATASNSGARPTDINLDTEAQLVTSTDIAQAVADELHTSTDGLTDQVSVSVPPNTELLDITFTDNTAAGAQRGSLAFAQAYLDHRKAGAQADLDAESKALQGQIDAVNKQLQQVIQAGLAMAPDSSDRARNDQQASAMNQQLANLDTQQNQLAATVITPGSIVTQPTMPSSPSSPNRLVTLAAGIVLGLLVGLGVAALRNRADDVIRHPEDLFRRIRVPVAAVLPGRLRMGQVTIQPQVSADGRGYARLRNLVVTGLAPSGRPVVVVAGVRHGGGPVALNLAAALARAGENVHFVCADVYADTSARLLRGAPRAGLAEVLAGDAALEQALEDVPGVPGLRILGAGRDPDRADALLQTGSPRKLVNDMLRSASYVVIEAPPTSYSPDAQTLASVAELAVVVVELEAARASEVLDACAQFESMGTPVLGAVAVRYGKGGDREAKKESTRADETVEAVEADDAGRPAAGEPAGREQSAEDGAPAPAPPGATASGANGDGANGHDAKGDAQLVPPGLRNPLAR